MSFLLASKFHPPAPPAAVVQRERILARLNQGWEAGRLVTLVSAPAGFGKTTCVSAWLGGLNAPSAWLSLDPRDNEPARFFTCFTAALQTVDSALGAEIGGVVRAGQVPPGAVICDALLNDILAYPRRFILVLDDLHVIQDQTVLEVLEQMIHGLAQLGAAPLHLALLSREDPPLPLARLRAANRLTEIRTADLRFSPAEAGQFLNQSMRLGLDPAEVDLLEDRTEGWIVGLQLAALALQTGALEPPEPGLPGRSAALAHSLGGSHRSILSYLTEEVLSRQPEDIQRFLLETSILDAFNGDLCDAVTGRAGGRALLERLYRANLFLVPLEIETTSGGAARWFRYHHLFTGLLRERLALEGKDQFSQLHRRASRWYAAESGRTGQDGLIPEAVRHALAAEDYPFAVQLIEGHATSLLMQWQTRTVAAWMEALPAEWAAHSPKTNLAFAWLHLMSGSPALAFPYLERLRPLFDGPEAQPEPDLLAEWLALQAMLVIAQGNAADGLAMAKKALDLLLTADLLPGSFDRAGYLHSMIYLDMASACQVLEDDAGAIDAYQHIIRHGRASGDMFTELMGISALGLLALNRGELHFAHELGSRGEELVKRFGGLPPISQAVYGELGEVHFQWNEIERAGAYFQQSVRASTLSGYPDAGIYNAVFRSRLLMIEGRLEEAAAEIEQAVQTLDLSGATAVREELAAQQVRIALAQDRLAAAEAALAAPGLPAPLDLAAGESLSYPRGKLLLCRVRMDLYRVRTGGDMESLAEGTVLAGLLIDAALQRRYIPLAITALLLRGQLAEAAGSLGANDFARALALGALEGFTAIYIEEGPAAAQALVKLLEKEPPRDMPPGHAAKLLDALRRILPGPSRQSAGVEPGTEPLTARELEVLRLIAEGLTYEEIGGRLYISLNTVRTYVKAIYAKLDANNRTKAVAAARQRGIL
jgi:LuxR family transcriptional regulator, maltose regulon positive regulatory protein